MLRAMNHLRSLSGGQTLPQLFQCDDGQAWVLKLVGNHMGQRTLAVDWVGHCVAALLNVPIVEPSIVLVAQEALDTAPDDVRAWARPGAAFGTRFLRMATPIAGLNQLTPCRNLGLLGRLHVVDVWMDVLDRRKPEGWNLLVETNTPTGDLRVIDFGLGLSPILGLLAQDDCLDRFPRDLTLWEDRIELQDALSKCISIKLSEIETIVDSVPSEWLTVAERARMVELLNSRQRCVEELLGGG